MQELVHAVTVESMNSIEFTCLDPEVLKNNPVVPAKKMIPSWYKQLPQETRITIGGDIIPTIKQCMPAMDIITSGYIITNPYKIILEPKDAPGNHVDYMANAHVDYLPDTHEHKMCPVKIDDRKKHWVKIKQPWTVKTPPGYSCLFIQPFYNFKHEWLLFPAIVDTDQHDVAVHFPGYTRSKEKTVIEEGQPLMQVIPFKRDEWKMSTNLQETTRSKLDSEHNYQNTFHSKKKFT